MADPQGSLLVWPDGEVLLTSEIPVPEQPFSQQTLRGFRMDPVNVPGWAGVASKALFVVGGGINIFGSADSQWQQDAMEHPLMSTVGRIGSAALTGVTVGGGETAGTWAGAETGAGWGAAACSEVPVAILPCGAAGALLGGFAGSKVGGAFGSGVESLAKNAWHEISDGGQLDREWLHRFGLIAVTAVGADNAVTAVDLGDVRF